MTTLVIAGCQRETGGGRSTRARVGSGQGPESVMVVINDASARSREIGAYYAERRSIPAANLCHIESTVDEEVSRELYETRIERPIGECLTRRHLRDQVLFLVTTLDVPLKIKGSTGAGGTAAAVDSELTLLYSKLGGSKPVTAGSIRNPLFGWRTREFRHPDFPIYLVTRLAARSVESVRAMIDRSLAAENRGVAVIDLDSADDREGNNWLRTAAILLPENRVVIDESPRVLYDQDDVLLYASWGSNDKHRKRRRLGFGWVPGAIATEYVSTDGRTFARPPKDWTFGKWGHKQTYFAGSPQALTTDLIEDGATGASGHVYEPFLQGTPRPDYLFPAYLEGRTLAESFYLAIPSLSWMNIVVGDPLCRLPVDEPPRRTARPRGRRGVSGGFEVR